jgi:hypothetical protein
VAQTGAYGGVGLPPPSRTGRGTLFVRRWALWGDVAYPHGASHSGGERVLKKWGDTRSTHHSNGGRTMSDKKKAEVAKAAKAWLTLARRFIRETKAWDARLADACDCPHKPDAIAYECTCDNNMSDALAEELWAVARKVVLTVVRTHPGLFGDTFNGLTEDELEEAAYDDHAIDEIVGPDTVFPETPEQEKP